MIPSLKDKFPIQRYYKRLAHLQDFQKSNDDTNYNITSYSTLSQIYRNPTGTNISSVAPNTQNQDDNKEDDANMSQSPQSDEHPSPSTQTPQTASSTTPYSEN